MVGEGPPSMPLFSHVKGVDTDLRRYDEPDRLTSRHQRPLVSVASYLETGTVLAARRKSNRMRAIDDLDRFLEEAGIALVPVDVAQSRLAPRARIQFGRAWVIAGC